MIDLLVGTDRGIHRLSGHAERLLEGTSVAGLAPGYALVDDALWRLTGGGGWELAAKSGGRRLTCLLSARRGLLVGTDGAHLLAGLELEPVPAFDEVDGRDQWYTPWGGPADTRSITEDADGTLYVNVHVGGVVRSIDGGATWSPSGLDIHLDAHQVLARPGVPGQVLAATAYGLAVSDDAGASWAMEANGLHATYLRAVAAAGDTVLVSASEGHTGGQSALYRRPAGAAPGATFEPCRTGLPEWFDGNIDTGCLAAAGPTVAFGTPSGEVYRSDDGGRSWDRLAEGIGRVQAVMIGS